MPSGHRSRATTLKRPSGQAAPAACCRDRVRPCHAPLPATEATLAELHGRGRALPSPSAPPTFFGFDCELDPRDGRVLRTNLSSDRPPPQRRLVAIARLKSARVSVPAKATAAAISSAACPPDRS